MKKVLSFCLFILTISLTYGQTENRGDYKWWNPAKSGFPVLEGQAWPTEVKNFYDRLPARAESIVRKEVWELSHNGAGLKLLFKTTAKDIVVRYVVNKKNYAMNHFPATGVSGVDLYSKNNDGSWAWATGSYKFGDTISYTYSNLDLDSEAYKEGRTYHLYLPLYNDVSWLEVGVPEKESFTVLTPRKEKPIVVYGTSIAQGGCASRPGMAWTAILERDLGVPLVNLGFSGNGRLEEELIGLITEVDARVFVLDCLPNLSGFSNQEIESKVLSSVRTIRIKHPGVPILLTQHSGFVQNRLDENVRTRIINVNAISEGAYKKLIAEGLKDLYLLPASEVSMGTDGTVDGVHPTDFGMYKYAKAYEKILSTIFKKNIR